MKEKVTRWKVSPNPYDGLIVSENGWWVEYNDYKKLLEDVKKHPRRCKWQDGFDDGYKLAFQELKYSDGFY